MNIVDTHATPAPKINTVTPEEKKVIEKKVDKEIEGSFPASDPPSFNAGEAVGAPVARESESPKADDEAVLEAEKKVKTGDVAKPETY
jgi:hypothetical protein